MQSHISIEELERWVANGATWRPLEVSDQLAVVELCTCYGEPVDLARSEDPAVIRWVRAHRDDD